MKTIHYKRSRSSLTLGTLNFRHFRHLNSRNFQDQQKQAISSGGGNLTILPAVSANMCEVLSSMNSVPDKLPSFEKRSGYDRRHKKLGILSKYWLTGRRAAVRREEDKQRAYRIDRHSARTLAVILLIVMLSIIDAILTLHLVDRGATELNPVMDYYLGHGPLAFFWVKYMLTSAALIIILTNKTAYLFNTRFQVKILFVIFLVPFVLVIQWELYLLYSVYP